MGEGLLLDSDEIGKGLQGVHSGGLHGEDGTAGVTDELLEHGLGIVIVAVGEAGKGVERRVRRLLLKKIIIRVLFLPKC